MCRFWNRIYIYICAVTLSQFVTFGECILTKSYTDRLRPRDFHLADDEQRSMNV